MAYLNPRYNGRVGLYRTNEIERFGISGTYSYSFVNENPLTSPYWYTRSINLLEDYSMVYGNNIWRVYGTSSSGLQQDNVFGSSITFTDGDVISVEVPALLGYYAAYGRKFVYHNFCWNLDTSIPTYMSVFLGSETDGSNNGQASWFLNGSSVKSVTLPAWASTNGLKFIWDRSSGMSYIYIGSPNNGYNYLAGTYSMTISSMTNGATNSDPFFFTGLILSPTQSTTYITNYSSGSGYDNGYIVSSQQYNGLTGSNKDYYTSPGLSRINIKY